ncbi:MAG TPA: hypothetical protein V6D17_04730 [Candidatus Obscuribacterales bacterium]
MRTLLKPLSQLPLLAFVWLLLAVRPANAKRLEEVFGDMLAMRESDPQGFTLMIVSVGLIFSLATIIMAATIAYYIRHTLKKNQ